MTSLLEALGTSWGDPECEEEGRKMIDELLDANINPNAEDNDERIDENSVRIVYPNSNKMTSAMQPGRTRTSDIAKCPGFGLPGCPGHEDKNIQGNGEGRGVHRIIKYCNNPSHTNIYGMRFSWTMYDHTEAASRRESGLFASEWDVLEQIEHFPRGGKATGYLCKKCHQPKKGHNCPYRVQGAIKKNKGKMNLGTFNAMFGKREQEIAEGKSIAEMMYAAAGDEAGDEAETNGTETKDEAKDEISDDILRGSRLQGIAMILNFLTANKKLDVDESVHSLCKSSIKGTPVDKEKYDTTLQSMISGILGTAGNEFTGTDDVADDDADDDADDGAGAGASDAPADADDDDAGASDAAYGSGVSADVSHHCKKWDCNAPVYAIKRRGRRPTWYTQGFCSTTCHEMFTVLEASND